tara:strand:- start:300 stop:1328 length:1029 start_codon:yes stop_codon:yes gene_type:complete
MTENNNSPHDQITPIQRPANTNDDARIKAKGVPIESDQIGKATSDKVALNQQPEIGDNKWFLARDLEIDEELHERRAICPDDLARARQSAEHPEFWNPIPVVEKNRKVFQMDSVVFVQGIIENNPDAYVQVYFVSEERGMAIRIADNRKRHKREPMAKARQAHFLYLKKMPYEQIASLLGVKTSRISQMISEAKTEIKFERFGNLIAERSKIPARFWGSVYATEASRSKADEENPRTDGESRLDEFNAMIAKIVALGEPITLVEARARLCLSADRTAATRNRTFGESFEISGSDEKIWFDAERDHGRIILPKLSQTEKQEVFEAIKQEVARILKARNDRPQD